jgi:hypothetical protein
MRGAAKGMLEVHSPIASAALAVPPPDPSFCRYALAKGRSGEGRAR